VTSTLLRRTAWASGILVLAGILALAVDWGIAARRARVNDALVLELQEQVKEDAEVAPKLEAEQKRITDSLLARRERDRAIGWVLLAAAAVFLPAVQRLAASGRQQPVAMPSISAARDSSHGKHKRKKQQKHPAPSSGPADSAPDLNFVDQAVALHGRNREAAIPLLQAMQQHYRYLPADALRRLCAITEITPSEIAGTASFYGQFRRVPVGRHVVRVCHGTACHVAGARHITEELRRHFKIPEGFDTDADHTFTIEEVACLGCCSLAPVLMVDEHTSGRLTAASAAAALEAVKEAEEA
jgi:NADH:ubiquinone oxidoreductase subunit E